MHNPELYLPATPGQLRQFAGKLDKAVLRLSGIVSEFENLCVENKIFLGPEQFINVQFEYGRDGEEGDIQDDVYRVIIGHVLPITKEDSPEPILTQLRTYLGTSDEEIESMTNNLQEELGYEIDLSDMVEGYVEYENTLSIRKIGRLISGNKMHLVNFMDEEYTGLESVVGAVGDTTETKEEMFLIDDSYPAVLDTLAMEYDLSQPSAADLIIAAKALMAVGILNKRVIPFRGAEKYMDKVPLLSFKPE